MTEMQSQVDRPPDRAANGAGEVGRELLLESLRRVHPIQGMVVDVDTWRDAHEYHRAHARLHHMALHGWGIATGLGVNSGESVNALLIQPGVAVDAFGNLVVVDSLQVHRIEQRTRGMLYVVLTYRDAPEEGQPSRVSERFSIEERTSPPAGADIELIRIQFDPQAGAVHVPVSPEAPGTNELDPRGRRRVAVSGAGDGTAVGATSPSVPGEIRERLESMGQRLDQLQQQLASAPQPDLTLGPRLSALADQMHDLGGQVQTLWQRPTVTPSGDGQAVAADGAPQWQVDELRARVESVVRRIDTLAQNLTDTSEQLQGANQQREQLTDQMHAIVDQVTSTRQVVDQLGSVRSQFENIPFEIEGLRDRLDRLPADLDRTGPELESLHSSMASVEQRVVELAERTEAPATAPTTMRNGWDRADQHPAREVRWVVGRHAGSEWDQHVEGLRLLAREISRCDPDTRVNVLEPVELDQVPDDVDLVYLSGDGALPLDDVQVAAIRRVLDAGGTVIGEGCAAGPSGETGAREFAFSFIELGQRLGRRLARVERDNPILVARFVFGEPPAGSRPARLLEDGGMVYSDADYGCAWQGGAREQPLTRATIRDALEFGVNLATYRQLRR